MAFKVSYKASVEKDLRKVAPATLAPLLDRVEGALGADPHSFPRLKGPFAALRKLRIGQYRILFTIQGDTVIVLRVAHRKEAYR